MTYLVIGAGGTGGPLAAYLTKSGKETALIARGMHLKKMQEEGLVVTSPKKGTYTVPVRAFAEADYSERPDVIFVCVKGYSISSILPLIRRCAKEDTIVIPILNIYGTGEKMAEELPGLTVTDGCIYIASEIESPGHVLMNGEIFRVVYGLREPESAPAAVKEKLKDIEADLRDAGITPLLTDHVRRDCLRKFSYVSAAAACGEYYHAAAGPMQEAGEIRDTYAALVHEIEILASAMGIDFGEDMVRTNLDILDSLTPLASTSMQRDIAKGGASEIDGLVYEVLRMAERYGVDLPTYKRLAAELKKRGLS